MHAVMKMGAAVHAVMLVVLITAALPHRAACIMQPQITSVNNTVSIQADDLLLTTNDPSAIPLSMVLVNTTITSTLPSMLNSEIARAMALESSIALSLDVERTRALAAESAEASRAISVETALSSAIVSITNNLAATLSSSVAQLSQSTAAMSSAVASVFASMAVSMAQEKSRALTVEAIFNTGLLSEVSRATARALAASAIDTTLSAALISEVSRAISRENSFSVVVGPTGPGGANGVPGVPGATGLQGVVGPAGERCIMP